MEFAARVLKQTEDSGKTLLTLSETAFYPTSGGQPFDTGTIAGVDVLDVYEADGEIVHVLEEAAVSLGDVTGLVDWTRRHDHMQQHTGQHIFSQAILKTCDTPTVGFALGPDWSTLVLGAKPDPESLQAALNLANSIIDEDRPIDILFPKEGELELLPIRGSVPEKDQVRVIRVDDFDWSPCGGTHCNSTGDVRLIQVLGLKKEKNTYRLEFVCGRRAEKTALRNSMAIRDVAQLLDVGPDEVVDRTRALVEKARAQEKAIDDLREARLTSDSERLLAAANEANTHIIATSLADRTIQELRLLSLMLVEPPGMVALLVGSDRDKVGMVFARSTDREEDMNEVMKLVCSEFGCRGGGNPSVATGGGGADVNTATVLEAAKKALPHETSPSSNAGGSFE